MATAEQYKQQILKLLPQGRVFDKSEGTNLEKLVSGLSKEFERMDTMVNKLPSEVNPKTTESFIQEWLDATIDSELCTDVDETIEGKRSAILGQLLATGGASKKYFQDVALALNIPVKITDKLQPAKAGITRAGEPVTGDGWAYTWIVNGPEQSARYLKAGTGKAGEPLVSYGNNLLQCVFERLKPAHTTILFLYVTVSRELAATMEAGLTATASIQKKVQLGSNVVGSLLSGFGDGWIPSMLPSGQLFSWFDAKDLTTAGAIETFTNKTSESNLEQPVLANRPDVVLNDQNGNSVLSFAAGDNLEASYSDGLLGNSFLNVFLAIETTTSGSVVSRNAFDMLSGASAKLEAKTESWRGKKFVDITNPAPRDDIYYEEGVLWQGKYLYRRRDAGLYAIDLTTGAESIIDGNGFGKYRGGLAAGATYAWLTGSTVHKLWRYDGTNIVEYTVTPEDGNADLGACVVFGNDCIFLDRSNKKVYRFDGTTLTKIFDLVADGHSASGGLSLTIETDGTTVWWGAGIPGGVDSGKIFSYNGSSVSVVASANGLQQVRTLKHMNGTLWFTSAESFNTKLGNLQNGVANTMDLSYHPNLGSQHYTYDDEHIILMMNTVSYIIPKTSNNALVAADIKRVTNSGNKPNAGGSYPLVYNNDIFYYNGTVLYKYVQEQFIEHVGDSSFAIYNFELNADRLKLRINSVEVASLLIGPDSFVGNVETSLDGTVFLEDSIREIGNQLEVIAATDGIVSFVNDVVTINPANDLPANSFIDIEVDSGFATGQTERVEGWSFKTV